MYRITLTQRPVDGADVAEIMIEGRPYQAISKNSATMKLARRLVEAGFADGPWQAVFPDGRSRFGGPSLHRLAKLAVRESDRSGLRLQQYRAFGGRPAKAAPSGEADRDRTLASEAVLVW